MNIAFRVHAGSTGKPLTWQWPTVAQGALSLVKKVEPCIRLCCDPLRMAAEPR